MQEHEVCFEMKEVLRSKSTPVDWAGEDNNGCVGFMGPMARLVEMLDEQRELLVLLTAVDTGVVTFEAKFERLRERGDRIDVIKMVHEIGVHGTRVDAGEGFVAHRAHLRADELNGRDN